MTAALCLDGAVPTAASKKTYRGHLREFFCMERWGAVIAME